MAKRLDIYKLGVVLDVDGAKGLSTLKATDKELKAVDLDARRAEGSLGKFTKGLNRVTSALKGNASGAGSSFLPGLANISQVIQGLPQIGQLAHALVSPLTDAAEAGIQFNAFLETNEIALKRHFGGSRDLARRFVGEVRDFAQKSPFSTEGLIKSVIYGTATGFSPKDALALIKDVGDAIASTGDLSEDMVQGVVRALSQMKAKGSVSAEEMEQLAERGIPAWEMLAHAIGKTVAETRKLSEQGKLSGVGAVEAMRAEMRARYGGTMKEMEDTLSGRRAAALDIVQSAQAKAMEGTTQNISDTLGMMLKRGDAPARMAAVFDQMLTPVSGMIKVSARGLLGGSLTEGLSEGITAGKDLVMKTVGGLALDSVINPFKKLLGINSPSTVYAAFGVNVAEGFENGLVDRTSRGFDRWAVALEKAGGEAFIKAVEAMSRRLGIDPAWMLNVMAFESGISAKAKNNGSSARGLIQFMNKTAKGLGLNNSNQFLGMNAMQQLPYVERYFQPYAGKMHNQGDVYAAVAGPAALSRRDRTLYRAGSKEYNANRVWDVNRDGTITAPEIGGLASSRGQFRGMGDVSSSNPLPVMIMGGAGVDFSAGNGGSFNPGAAPQVLWRARKELTQTIQDTGTVVVEVQATAEQLIETNRDIAGAEQMTFHALLPLPEAIDNATVAAGQFAKTVITSGQDMSKKLMSALSGIGGMMPQQQVGKKRGFLSKLLGVAAPFLNFIPGAGPLLSTLATIGSSALGGDWGGALMGVAGGFASGGAFRRTPTPSAPLAPQAVNFTNPATRLPAREFGGPVSRGRAYLVGERRAEVFTPEEDGFIHPSIDAFKRTQSGGSNGGGFSGGGKDGFWNQWREHFDRLAGAIEKFETMSPGEVLTRGAKTHPGAIGDGLKRASTRDPKVSEWMRRNSS